MIILSIQPLSNHPLPLPGYIYIPGYTVVRETREEEGSHRRVDFKVSSPTGTLSYDVRFVSLAQKNARSTPAATLLTAERIKNGRYQNPRRSFKPLVFSQGGLMARESAKAYRELLSALAPNAQEWLGTYLSMALLRFQARTWNGFGVAV